jgi:hypothetical protein
MKDILQSLSITTIFVALVACTPQAQKEITWKHLSSKNGDITVPNEGNQQTATALFDVNKDGINDFFSPKEPPRLP